jgi:hypothetical protein
MMNKGYNNHQVQTPMPPVSVIERPDQAQFHVRISVETEGASAALALLKRAALRLEESLTPLGATSAVTDFDLPAESGKVEALPSSVQLLVTLPLSRSGSAWERAAKVAQVDDLFRTLILEGKKQKPKLEAQRALPVFLLADPESQRQTLVKRLHDRARTLGGGQAVKLQQLRFDQPVEQRSIGLEQVELTLRVDGCAELELSKLD